MSIELSLFPAPVVFGQGGGGWLTTMCIKLCSSWMEIEFQDIIQIAWNEALPQGWKLHGVSQGPSLNLSIALIKYLKGLKCLGLLFNVKNQKVAQ